MRDLAPKQARFVEGVPCRSERDTGSDTGGYSQRTATSRARDCRPIPVSVRSLISAAKSRLSERTGRTVAAVMADIGVRVGDDAMREA